MTVQPLDEEAIFHAARAMGSPAERADYLAEACGDNQALRARVEGLLKIYADEKSFAGMPSALLATLDHQPISERPGTVIGPYKLMEQIGEGGFGLVFVAEQQQPVRRKVALKVIKPGMDTRDVIARFEAERQALALMDHPNIARVFDAGATDSGRPYFVMELVRGIPITEYCDQQHLTPRERLELFVSLCHAIQHAHQKGIIHRDVKPSNVLVTEHDGRPVVKVIDFGVAKALSQQLTQHTIYTQFAQMIGTPLYMSPEQAAMSGLDIDTRSDIYSLGVLLYELLTGSTPFDRKRLQQAAADEIRRIIREEEPPKPSTRLSQSGDRLPSIAALRNTEPAGLSKLVRGDLDWIVMKCLEKDRARRYETANGLARDVECYLHDQPVSACPPSAAYRFRKFARRNKAALGVAAVLAVMLLVAVGAVGVYGLQQRRLAQEQKELADDRNQFANEQSQSVQRLEGIQRQTQTDLYRTLLGQAAALGNARESGYRRTVWANLHEAMSLDVAEKDLNQIRDQVLACLGDPIGLGPIRDVSIKRQVPAKIPAELQEVIKSPTWGPVATNGQMVAKAMPVDGEWRLSVWASDGKPLGTTVCNLGVVHALAITPDGQLLVAACENGTLVWEIPSLHQRTYFRGPDLHSVAVDPGGRRMATRSRLQRIELWSLASNRPLGGLWAPQGTTDIEFSANGQFLLALQRGEILSAWFVAGTPEKLYLAGHVAGVTGICFSPNGRKLASVGHDRVVRIWDVASGSLLHACTGHQVEVQTVAFSPDGQLLASGDWAGEIRLWDPESGQQLAHLAGLPGMEAINRLRFDPNGKYLAAAGTTLAAWAIGPPPAHLASEPFLQVRPQDRLWDLVIHPDGRNMVCVTGLGDVLHYNREEGPDCRLLVGINSLQRPYFTLHFDAEGQHLRFVTSGRQIATWNWQQGALVHTTEREFLDPTKTAMTADHHWAAIVSPANSVLVFDLQASRDVFTLPEEDNEIWSLDYSPDGTLLALGLSDGQLAIWKLEQVRERLAEFGISVPSTAARTQDVTMGQ